MAALVVDASVTLSWCFEDERSSWTDTILDRLGRGDRTTVPAHWPTEVTNGLLTGIRRQRIRSGRAEQFWDELSVLPIDVEPGLSAQQARATLALSQQFELTAYDAAYLELAIRRGLPLATLDAALSRAATGSGVRLIVGEEI